MNLRGLWSLRMLLTLIFVMLFPFSQLLSTDGGLVFSKPSHKPAGMVLIPAGEFVMGNVNGAIHEKPSHQVFLDAYYIGQHEVTNAEYYAFWLADGAVKSAHTPISFGNQTDIDDWPQVAKTSPDSPVVGISWSDAAAYAKRVGKRLPTEAEWEKAARGTDGRSWPWGNAFSMQIRGKTNHANVWRGEDGYANGVVPVGTYPTGASPYGAFDMAGNVWEWVADWYSESYYHWGTVHNPKGPKRGGRRVVRGGSWANGAQFTQCTHRMGHYPAAGTSFIGFRLVKDVK